MRQITNIREIEEFLEENNEIVIEKNSKNTMVVMSMEEYKEKKLSENIEKSILEAEEDIKNGKLKDAEEVFGDWKVRYGI